ncbi:TetR family transcriptional regulator [Actinorhabdospora filicis]|uniref:TetR family transcriptional regulator n=1 Tax=Actinorhabdospora filicis TaxID=1785913 RepID=A0A9W6SQ75_9ACTN|nr:TetR/AcrR family transcriptional regulator [Actinorhabdospora filicis]GLZ80343.1 TetR family transcriptional regulator [Actinorhabdospora filicis]
MTNEPARRPGGRSARVRAAVHAAVAELIAERGYGGCTVKDIAARAGVADTSIYRRWGDLNALLIDVALARLTDGSPLPDTGDLPGDLTAYAAQVARDITGPAGPAIPRLMAALSEAGTTARAAFVEARSHQLNTMLTRAHDRGEPVITTVEILDHVLAPMYTRVLFGVGGVDEKYAADLVKRALERAS